MLVIADDLDFARNSVEWPGMSANGDAAQDVAGCPSSWATRERASPPQGNDTAEVASSRSPIQIANGIRLRDHMLEQVERHGGFARNWSAGRPHIDEHNTSRMRAGGVKR